MGMKHVGDAAAWAEETFGSAGLGDARRTRRLVRLGAALAAETGASASKACGKSDADVEGAYRLLRNDEVSPREILAAGFRATARRAGSLDTFPAVEDSTTLSYTHQAVDELGDLGGTADSSPRGVWVHSVLLVDAASSRTVGLIEQSYWMREPEARGKRHDRRQRDYEEKESYKWQHASEQTRLRLGDEVMKRVVSVCDREADVYPYLAHKMGAGERFVVRAQWDRTVLSDGGTNPEKGRPSAVLNAAPVAMQVTVDVPQRSGRPAHTATLTLRARKVRLRRPRPLPVKYPAR